MLENKNAVIYGAGGSLGGAVAKALAQAGARVFLTGRHNSNVQRVADQIRASGGKADVAQLDAMNQREVDTHLQLVLEKAGTVDISYNAIDLQSAQGVSLYDMKLEDFVRPINIAMQTHFLTATASAKIMMKQGAGVILSLTATSGAIGYPYTGKFAPACYAIESFAGILAAEIGIYGVRVVNIRSAGSPDSNVFKKEIENHPDIMKSVLEGMENG